jgi:proteic killer suppression protein
MIKSFADKRTRAFFEGTRVAAFAAFARQAQRRLALLDVAQSRRALQALPSNRFEALGGDRLGQHSIRVNDQWRICFRWAAKEGSGDTADPLDVVGDAVDVEITDYH